MGVVSRSGWNLWVWLAGGRCGWNLWVWLVGEVVRRYIDFLIILLIPTPLVSALFAEAIMIFIMEVWSGLCKLATYQPYFSIQNIVLHEVCTQQVQ